ncbi:MAG: ImmA/IrrE family metallo-endopeptidase [Desulfuromonadales bacterium]|nr:ImmA/IrrE family metallo-endopeptidase [Desulfuromonadales bacterium]
MAIGYLRLDEINEKAEKFLLKYNPGRTFPLPIEMIVERDLQFQIVPMENLQAKFEADGFLTADLKSIYVDDYVFRNRPNRYRFTLAHEVGHSILHKDLFNMNQFTNVSDWQEYIAEMDPLEYRKLEFQGPQFAGFVLVPRPELEVAFKKNIPIVEPILKGNKYRIGYAIEVMAGLIAPKFGVSDSVIERRIKTDSLHDLIM